jgi:type I restriction enzyme S subunit
MKAGEGGTPDTTKSEYYDNGNIPFVKIDDLSNKYLTNNRDYITELGLQKSSAWIVPTNSVIYSNGATIGAVSINCYPVSTKQGILGIVPTKHVDSEYLYYLLTAIFFKKEITRIITKGTMMTAYLKDINSIKCPLPSISKQKEITAILSKLSGKIEVEKQLLHYLEVQKLHLLQQMII